MDTSENQGARFILFRIRQLFVPAFQSRCSLWDSIPVTNINGEIQTTDTNELKNGIFDICVNHQVDFKMSRS